MKLVIELNIDHEALIDDPMPTVVQPLLGLLLPILTQDATFRQFIERSKEIEGESAHIVAESGVPSISQPLMRIRLDESEFDPRFYGRDTNPEAYHKVTTGIGKYEKPEESSDEARH